MIMHLDLTKNQRDDIHIVLKELRESIKNAKIIISLLFIAVSISYAYENTDSSDGEHRQKRQPPVEAITICEGKSSEESCSMTTPRGDMIKNSLSSILSDSDNYNHIFVLCINFRILDRI